MSSALGRPVVAEEQPCCRARAAHPVFPEWLPRPALVTRWRDTSRFSPSLHACLSLARFSLKLPCLHFGLCSPSGTHLHGRHEGHLVSVVNPLKRNDALAAASWKEDCEMAEELSMRPCPVPLPSKPGRATQRWGHPEGNVCLFSKVVELTGDVMRSLSPRRWRMLLWEPQI